MFVVRVFAASVLTSLLATPALAQAPSAPQNLTNLVNGTVVTLSWTAPAAGPVTGYVVEASVTPGGPLVASLPVASTSLVVPNVPPGVYFVRVRALTGGASSGPSNETTVSVGGSSGCPAPPLPPRLIVRAQGLDVSLNWGSSGGCGPTSYVVQAGSAPGLANIAVVNVGGGLGLAATAPPGVYYIRVIGSNAFGSASSQELVARIAPNNVTDTILPGDAQFFDITLTQNGTYVGRLVWDDPSIDLDLYLTTAGCPYPPVGCTLAISDTSGTTVEQVSRPVSAGERYRLWVDNFTNRATAFTLVNTVVAGSSVTGTKP